MSASQARQPAGVPVGGQFATTARGEAGLALVPEHPPLTEGYQRGVWSVVDSTKEELTDGPPGIMRTMVHMQGRPDVRAATGMAALRMQRSGQFDEYPPQLRTLAEASSKATVLRRTRNGDVEAREGTLFLNGESIGLVNKGDRSGKGIWLYDPTRPDAGSQVLAVAKGYGAQEALAAQFRAHADQVPATEPTTFDDLPVAEADVEPPSAIAAVYSFTHPGFEEGQDGRGSLFFVTDFQPGDGSENPWGGGVVNGYGIYPPESGLESEHGSMYARDLKRWGGRVKGYQPGSHTFRDVMGLAKVADDWRGDNDIEAVWSSVKDATR